MIFFFILDWNNTAIWIGNPSDFQRLIAGSYESVITNYEAFFQSASTRTAGFSVVDISAVNQAMWVLWLGTC